MAQKVAKLGIQRDNNYLYYIKGGDVWQVPRKRPGMKKQKASKLASAGVTMESGFMYFVDKAGDVARVKASVGGQKRKKKVRRTPTRTTAKKTTKTARRTPAKRGARKVTKAKRK